MSLFYGVRNEQFLAASVDEGVECVCVSVCVRERRPREGITMAMSRHSDWHHIQMEGGGTEMERKENQESHKENKRG